VSDKWYNQKQIRALVGEYEKNRNSHRLNREVVTEKGLEFVKSNKEYNMLRYREFMQKQFLEDQKDMKKEEALEECETLPFK